MKHKEEETFLVPILGFCCLIVLADIAFYTFLAWAIFKLVMHIVS